MSTTVESKATQRLRYERRLMLSYEPFWGRCALYLRLVEKPEIDTAATDGKCLYFNPDFILKLPSGAAVRGLIAHEVAHCVFAHPTRMEGRKAVVVDQEGNPVTVWNLAADYAINARLAKHEASKLALPDGALMPGDAMDPEKKYDGPSTEWIYDDILRKLKQSGKSISVAMAGAARWGGVEAPQPGEGEGQGEDGSESAKEAAAKLAEDWRGIVAASARQAGKHCPDYIQQELSERAKPKHNYRDLLQRFAEEVVRTQPTWARPHRRLLAAIDTYLPSNAQRVLGTLGVFIDTSGSMGSVKITESLLAQCTRDAESVGQYAERTIVVCGDTRERWRGEFDNGETLRISPHGGGGTDFRECIAKLAAEDCTCILAFTDMECCDWGDDPGCPVLWLSWGSGHQHYKPPFGEVVVMEVGK